MNLLKSPYINVFWVIVSIICPILTTSIVCAQAENISAKPESIFLYTYHTHPPFIIEKNKGLSFDIARYLTQKAGGQYVFIVKAMSRPRVNREIANAQSGIVPWVNPVWFNDQKEEKYMWTKGVMMQDGNAIISHQENKIIYEGPESLNGMIFGGLFGHVYQGIDRYIKKSRQLVRVDAENHIDNFRKLVDRRIDVTLMPVSGAKFYIKQENLGDTLYISPKLHSKFERRAIIINKRSDILHFVDPILNNLAKDEKWNEIMMVYK